MSKDKDEVESEMILLSFTAITQIVLRPFVMALSEGKNVSLNEYMKVGEAMVLVRDAIMETLRKRGGK